MRNQLKASTIDPVRLFDFEGKSLERGKWSIHYKVPPRDASGNFDDTKILIGVSYKSDILNPILPFLRYFDYISPGGTPYASFDALIADLGTFLDLGDVDTSGGATNLSYDSATGTVESSTGTDAIISIMEGDSGAGGERGLVPDQSTGDAAKFLRGDGSWVAVAGGASDTVIEKTFADSGDTANDREFIVVDTAGGDTTINLPSLAASQNFVIGVSKDDASGNKVIVDADGTDLINNSGTIDIISDDESIVLRGGPSKWSVW